MTWFISQDVHCSQHQGMLYTGLNVVIVIPGQTIKMSRPYRNIEQTTNRSIALFTSHYIFFVQWLSMLTKEFFLNSEFQLQQAYSQKFHSGRGHGCYIVSVPLAQTSAFFLITFTSGDKTVMGHYGFRWGKTYINYTGLETTTATWRTDHELTNGMYMWLNRLVQPSGCKQSTK